jgi:hypothetical protein
MRKLVQVNADIGGKNKGDRFHLDFDGNVPIVKFWRRRFNDAEIDHCVEVVEEKPTSKIKKGDK